jgi:endonuclease IV|tara:strand:+ start:1505 stop:1717 length:213 start_codon:yes stop_codon:yes gene_type:complete
MTMYKVKEHPALLRDSRSKAILNTDLMELNKMKKERESTITIQTLTQEVNVIKNEFQEIKTLLKQIVAKR